MSVDLRPGESQESLLKRFRKSVSEARILPIVRQKRWFISKSEVRRIKKQKAIRKAQRGPLPPRPRPAGAPGFTGPGGGNRDSGNREGGSREGGYSRDGGNSREGGNSRDGGYNRGGSSRDSGGSNR